MSRRHHGRPHHPRSHHDGPRPGTTVDGRPAPAEPAATHESAAPVNGAPLNVTTAANGAPVNGAPRVLAGESIAKLATAPSTGPAPTAAPPKPIATDQQPPALPVQAGHDRRPAPNQNGPMGDRGATCTAPQLRRFIKSRPYVPMHELRRRFGIDGQDDDVTGVS